MEIQQEISFAVNHIHRQWRRAVCYKQAAAGLDEDTIMYGRVLGYISRPENQPVFQKNIEQDMDMNKSTVSMLLTKLEKKDYVTRKSVEDDARLKKLELTPHGEEVLGKIGNALYEADQALISGFSEEEEKTFLSLLKRMENNMKELEEKTL